MRIERQMRNDSIQNLRGISAMMVFFSHALMMYRNEAINSLYHSPFHFFFDGSVAVYVFFAISGFFYYKDTNYSTRNYVKGIGRKIKKIYPSHFVVLIIATILCNMHLDYPRESITDWGNGFWHQEISIEEVLKQSLILFPRDTLLINPPSWYLNIEVTMFLAMPFVVSVFNKIGWRWSILLYVFSFITGFFRGISYYSIAAYAHYLICNDKMGIRYFLEKRHMKTILLSVAVLMINNCNEIVLPDDVSVMMKAVGAAILVVIVFVTPFSYKPLKYIGNISYEFYLIHFPILLTMRTFGVSHSLYILLSLTITIVGAFILDKMNRSIWDMKVIRCNI